MREDGYNYLEEQLPQPEELVPLSQTLISPDLATAFDIESSPHQQPPPISTPNWTPKLHNRFADAVAYLGIKNAVPKTLMQLMSVDGLTRENVASHLKKYRQHMSSGGTKGDSVTGRLFASSPVPPQFLHSEYANENRALSLFPTGDD